MRELEKPVARVFRRLRLQRFVSALVWVLAIALAAGGRGAGCQQGARSRVAGAGVGTFRHRRRTGHDDCRPVRDLHRAQPARRRGGHRSCLPSQRTGQHGVDAAGRAAQDLGRPRAPRRRQEEAGRPGRDFSVRTEAAAQGVGRPDTGGPGGFHALRSRRGSSAPSRPRPRRRSMPRPLPSKPRRSPRRSRASGRRSTRTSSPRPRSCWPRSRRKPKTWPRPPRRRKTSYSSK